MSLQCIYDTQPTTVDADGEADIIKASLLLGPKKCRNARCVKLRINFLKLEIDLHEYAEYQTNGTVLLKLLQEMNKLLPDKILSPSPKKIIGGSFCFLKAREDWRFSDTEKKGSEGLVIARGTLWIVEADASY